MAFLRTNLTGVSGVGSNGPALYTYFGVEADLTVENLKSTNIKPNDIIMLFDGVNAVVTKGVDSTFALI